jgi:hypothetical protein
VAGAAELKLCARGASALNEDSLFPVLAALILSRRSSVFRRACADPSPSAFSNFARCVAFRKIDESASEFAEFFAESALSSSHVPVPTTAAAPTHTKGFCHQARFAAPDLRRLLPQLAQNKSSGCKKPQAGQFT